MPLTLRAVSLNDLPITQPITATFDLLGGTVGRSDHNTLALPDPERRISRRQAEIRADRSGFVIKNVGSANPIIVGSRSIAQGESAPLPDRGQLRIGGYLLEVMGDAAASAVPAFAEGEADRDTQERVRGATDAGPPAAMTASRSGSDGMSRLGFENPFADLLAGPRPFGASATSGPRAARAGVDASARLPDDFDPFAAPAREAPRAAPSAASEGVFGDLIPTPAGASIDDLFDLRPVNSRDLLADFLDETPAPAAIPVGGGAAAPGERRSASRPEPAAIVGGARHVPAQQSAADHTPELHSAYVPPRVVREVRDPPVASPATGQVSPAVLPTGPSHDAWNGDPAQLWTAFCEGAGTALELPAGGEVRQMRVVGLLLRAAVEGTVQLMAMRSATRHELHAQVTVIRPLNNNPLKFSPDGQSALEQLLRPPLRGFLPGPAAMTEAMQDLLGHAIGTMAGTRAALEGVLGRFSPQELEAKLSPTRVIDSVLPMNRKARLWELYRQHFESIREEAQDDFQALFGRAFLAAYEQQLERLRRERPSSAAE